MTTIPTISIIMPTLNSEKTIHIALASIHRQSLPISTIEVLIVDAGSTDRTRHIAKEFGCTILENPQILPEYGKSIGLIYARGRFGVFLDSDEELIATDSLESKICLLESITTVHSVITAGLSTPQGYGIISDYANRYGDPFSYFMHRLNGGDYLPDFRKRCRIIYEDSKKIVFNFNPTDMLPICDGGGHFFRLEYLRQITNVVDPCVVPRIFQLMASNHRQIGLIKGDFVRHYSTSTFWGLIRKIHWRVVGNVHYSHTGMPGQAAREKGESYKKIFRKYIFIPYSIILIGPLIETICLIIRHHHPGYILHFPLSIITTYDIILQLGLRLVQVQPKWKIYS